MKLSPLDNIFPGTNEIVMKEGLLMLMPLDAFALVLRKFCGGVRYAFLVFRRPHFLRRSDTEDGFHWPGASL